MKKTIFPDYNLGIVYAVDENFELTHQIHIDASTNLRIQDDKGDWYTVPYRTKYVLDQKDDKSDMLAITDCISRFISETYRFKVLGKVDKNSIESDHLPSFELDEYQGSEVERLSQDWLDLTRTNGQ